MLDFPRWKIALVLLVCALSVYITLPSILDKDIAARLPGVADTRVNLGLDLQGGSYLLLEVDYESYFAEQIENLRSDIRAHFRGKTVEGNRLRYMGGLPIQNNKVMIALADASQVEGVKQLLRELSGDIETEVEGSTLHVGYTESYQKEMKRRVLEQSVEIVRRRVDETGTREPDIQRQGENRILLQVPGLQNPEHLKNLLGKTAKLSFHLLDETMPFPDTGRGPVPPGSLRLKADEEDGKGNAVSYGYVIHREAIITGDMLVEAHATFSEGEPVVSFRFNQLGARKFADITKANVGRPFAIVLDNHVISAPVIREPILGGSGQISGRFTTQGANDLALLLRAGALPAPLHILEERTVGPSLGNDSIESGKKAVLGGIMLVMVFMILFYGRFGVFSDVALFINLFMIMAVLALFGATLTLPGIAGIVLTIGMAVDANVLIFERIREELRVGKTPYAAVDSGFRQAMSTILDSNLTTLVATFLLFQFGSGPVRGFAVTLSAGIITSMFSAILVTRMLVVLWLKRRRPAKLVI